MKQFLTILLIICVFYPFAQLPQVASGKIVRFVNFQSVFVSPRNVDVWLPANYRPSNKYAVLYMHDGQMLFDSLTTWNKTEWCIDETVSKYLAIGKIKNCIVVGIWNTGTGRHADYFPQKPFEALGTEQQDSLYAARRSNGASVFNGIKIHSDNYLHFLVKELKPFIDSAFSTTKERKSTFIAGSSMGGLISLYAICEYPQIFGGAACLSTHWPGIFTESNNPFPDSFLKYLSDKLPSPVTHKIYFDYGTTTLDSMYKPYQLKVNALMKQKKYSTKNWVTHEFTGESHSEAAWAKRFYLPLVFLLHK